MEVGDSRGSVGQVGDGFPHILGGRVAEPMNEVLKGRRPTAMAIEARITDGLHLILQGSVREEVRWGTGIVWTVGRSEPIG